MRRLATLTALHALPRPRRGRIPHGGQHARRPTWGWWGYHDADYARHGGAQLDTVMRMVRPRRLTGGPGMTTCRRHLGSR